MKKIFYALGIAVILLDLCLIAPYYLKGFTDNKIQPPIKNQLPYDPFKFYVWTASPIVLPESDAFYLYFRAPLFHKNLSSDFLIKEGEGNDWQSAFTTTSTPVGIKGFKALRVELPNLKPGYYQFRNVNEPSLTGGVRVESLINDPAAVSIRVSDTQINPQTEELHLLLSNNTENFLSTSLIFYLEQQINDFFIPYPMQPSTGINEIAEIITKDQNHPQTLNLKDYYGSLPPGTYRLSKVYSSYYASTVFEVIPLP